MRRRSKPFFDFWAIAQDLCRPVQRVVDKPAWFDFDLATCKGCGICAEECPHRAIAMVPEAA